MRLGRPLAAGCGLATRWTVGRGDADDAIGNKSATGGEAGFGGGDRDLDVHRARTAGDRRFPLWITYGDRGAR